MPGAAEELSGAFAWARAVLRSGVRRFRRQRQPGTTSGLAAVAVFDDEVDSFLSDTQESIPASADDSALDVAFAACSAADAAKSARWLAQEPGSNDPATTGRQLPLRCLRARLRLSFTETSIVVLLLTREVDAQYGRVFAYLHNDVSRPHPSVSLLLDLLATDWQQRLALRRLFAESAPLLRLGIVTAVRDVVGLSISDDLMLDGGIVEFLLGGTLPADAIASHGLAIDELVLEDASRKQIKGLTTAVSPSGAPRLLITLLGPASSGRRPVARALAQALGADIACRLLDLDDAGEEHFRQLRRWLRDVRLTGRWPLVELLGESSRAQSERALLQLREAVGGLGFAVAFLVSEREVRWPEFIQDELQVVSLPLRTPGPSLRRIAWQLFLERADLSCSPAELDLAASVYSFPVGMIQRAVDEAVLRVKLEQPAVSRLTPALLAAVCQQLPRHRLGELAEQIIPSRGWEDLRLDADAKQHLREVVITVRQRGRVMEDWGFGRKVATTPGLGLLFSGPSGTGKTLAAEILAGELGMALYRVDLSRLVDKYIGETEKNLARVFAEAGRASAILFFDEADALFGHRSEVRDAHDRYANIEAAYLLQRMEAFDGVVILATNLRKNIDPAFLRRLHFTVEFHSPSVEVRHEIWQQIWPRQVIVDKTVDPDFLSRQFELSGGQIRNVALRSAYLAAQEGESIALKHVLRAIQREFQKQGRIILSDEFAPYQQLVAAAPDGPV